MKKILLICNSFTDGGSERVSSLLVNELKNKDYDVYAMNLVNAKNTYYINPEIKIFKFISSKNKIINYIKKINYFRKTINRINPDVIINITDSFGWPFINFKKYYVISSLRNDPTKFKKRTQKLILKKFRLSKKIVFQTNDGMKLYDENIQKKGVVISNPLSKMDYHNDMSFTNDIIVTSCRLNKQKNLYCAIDAFEKIHKKYPSYKYYIYGQGEEKENILKYICEKNLQDSVLLMGYSSNVQKEIHNARVFVLSSNYEGISNSMLEALAMGIPCVCTDCPVGGAKMFIQDGVNGFLTKVGDCEDLYDKIDILLSNVELCKKISENSRKIENELNLNNIVAKWISLFEV